MQKTLIARTEILYNGKMYNIGEELPTNNPQYVDAWIEAGTAVWEGAEKAPSDTENEETDTENGETDTENGETDTENEKSEPVKGVPQTAEPGLAGKAAASESEDGVDLVGKVPKTAARSKK